MSFWKRLKLFWWNHWVKIAVVAWTIFIFWIPVAALGSIDSYQRSYMVAWLSTMGLQATISAVIFVVLYSWVLQGGIQKMKKKQVKSDAVNIKWKDVIAGAVVTAVLFMIGKFAISLYIGQSNVGGTYGATGSLVVVLLWTYYSSIILYFGAEFTKAYAIAYGSEIYPSHYAVTMKEVEVETGHVSIQDNHPELINEVKKAEKDS